MEDFDHLESAREKVEFLTRFAVLSPSSHNSQPWAFEVSNSSIKIKLEPSRLLPVGDSNNRQATISLGCAIENIAIAADYYGYSSDITYPTEQEILISLSPGIKQADKNHLIFSIPKRMVNRSPYSDEKVDDSLLEQIKSLAGDALKINTISDRATKDILAEIALRATSAAMANKLFREELSHYVISNTSKSKVGIPGFNMGFPTLLSYFAPTMLKLFDMSKLSNKADEKLLKKQTPYMIIISTKQDNPENWLIVGRIFQRISLITTSVGVSLAVWAASIQIGEYYKDIQKVVGTNFRPQMFFRMGYATNDMGGHSPRLATDDVISK